MIRIVTLLLLWLNLAPVLATAATDPVVDIAERHVRLQTQGLPGKVTISVGNLDPRTQLPPCAAHEAFTPPGAKLWGKTHVGVRCLGPNTWSVLVPVQITVAGQYVTTSRPLSAGQVLQPGDLAVMSGDLAALPAGIVTDPAAAIGKTLKNSLAAGQSLRADQLLAPLVIRQGQTVRLISKGPGFSVSGVAKADGSAEIAN